MHSCFYLISYIVIEAAVQNQERILSRRPSVISQIFKKSTVSFGLITFFALKVLFVDIFITVGDVCTDFWQVRVIELSNKQCIWTKVRTVQFRKVDLDYITLQGIELLFREGLYSYGWIIIAANWVPGMVASFHILHMYRGINKLPAKTTLMYTGRLQWFSSYHT